MDVQRYTTGAADFTVGQSPGGAAHGVGPVWTGSPVNEMLSWGAGSLGGDAENIPVHSLRLHGAKAHQEVIFGSVGQYLTVRHDTTDYECFAPGVILSLRKIGSLDTGVTVGLESLLGI